MSIPPFLRRIQQSYSWHIAQSLFIGTGSAAFACFVTHNDFTVACVKTGLIISGGALFVSLQHSPGSASFKPDGTPNEVVEKVVAAQSIGVPVVADVPPDAERKVAAVMTKQ
jgi:hypothetical protein